MGLDDWQAGGPIAISGRDFPVEEVPVAVRALGFLWFTIGPQIVLRRVLFAWLRCGIRWKNTAFLHSQSNIWNSFLIWNILTSWLWFSWSFTGAKGNLAACQGKRNPQRERFSFLGRKQRLPSRSKRQPACICLLPLCQLSCWTPSQTWFHWLLTVIPPGRLDHCPWARENAEARRN